MKTILENKDIHAIMRMVKTDLRKNVCGYANPQLYRVALTGTKQCIEDYQAAFIKCIQFVYYYKGSQISFEQKLEFFNEATKIYGKTGLFFSGGASMAKFHFGILKALIQ